MKANDADNRKLHTSAEGNVLHGLHETPATRGETSSHGIPSSVDNNSPRSLYDSATTRDETAMAQERTEMSSERTAMATERTAMAYERTAMAVEQTEMAYQRTNLTNTQTLLSYTRTAIGLLAAGVGMFAFVNNQSIVALGLILSFLAPVVQTIGLIHFVLSRRRLNKIKPPGMPTVRDKASDSSQMQASSEHQKPPADNPPTESDL